LDFCFSTGSGTVRIGRTAMAFEVWVRLHCVKK
jgi:hypothetical protein